MSNGPMISFEDAATLLNRLVNGRNLTRPYKTTEGSGGSKTNNAMMNTSGELYVSNASWIFEQYL